MAEAEILGPNDEVSIATINSAGMDAATRSEINLQVQFAQDHPRSITTVRKNLEELVTLDQSIAEESFYTLKRTDKNGGVKLIQGPSIRFAEVLVYCWGNSRSGIQISDVSNEFVTGEGVFFDLQTNNVVKIRTSRRITDKNGRKYNTDMIQTTGNAAASLAYRNAVTRAIPKALYNDILEKAKIVAIGKGQSMDQRRTAAIEYGKKIGVTQDQIFSTLGVQGLNDIGVDELISLKGLFNAVKSEESTIEEAFGDPFEKEVTGLMDQLGWNKGRRDVATQNYKGRSQDLLKYLREQAEALNPGQAATTTEAAKDAPPAEAKTEAKGKGKKGAAAEKVDTKPDPEPEAKPEPELQVEEKKEEPKPEPTPEPKPEVKQDAKPTKQSSGSLDFTF